MMSVTNIPMSDQTEASSDVFLNEWTKTIDVRQCELFVNDEEQEGSINSFFDLDSTGLEMKRQLIICGDPMSETHLHG